MRKAAPTSFLTYTAHLQHTTFSPAQPKQKPITPSLHLTSAPQNYTNHLARVINTIAMPAKRHGRGGQSQSPGQYQNTAHPSHNHSQDPCHQAHHHSNLRGQSHHDHQDQQHQQQEQEQQQQPQGQQQQTQSPQQQRPHHQGHQQNHPNGTSTAAPTESESGSADQIPPTDPAETTRLWKIVRLTLILKDEGDSEWADQSRLKQGAREMVEQEEV
ncbi:uncharacterized protein BKCO1_6000178 [Diplodia corticola]|uniref:Uncharacterized protein n=1 Tax=Diplodia corticola TaxID=236234 RepID=A0A1J9RB65_9PEZI|nr:uncharacterized protein BKCO1_6000178 [Diplodia corticola]OJD37713.1 hypothetical protein BKCO1_6000178 [Diplodia corticola]